MEERRLCECIEDWLSDVKTKSVKPLTLDRLKVSFKMLRKYQIAEVKVCDLRSLDIQRYINELVEDGYSLSTIRKQYNLITAYWKWAMSQNVTHTPIYLGVELPSVDVLRIAQRDVSAYSKRDQELIMERTKTLEKPQYGAVVLMLEAGLRIGEVLALSWDDILWQKKAVRIHRTLIRMSSEATTYIQDSAKSRSSRRTIPLSETALEVLQKLKLRKIHSDLVFARPDNPRLPYSYSSIEFHVRQLCKDLEISYLGLHAFRHTFATNCYERGCDVKILSKLLGHHDVAITYNIYIHLYGDALEEMRKVIE